MITARKQPVTQQPAAGIERPINTSLKLKSDPLNYKRGTPRLLSRVRVYSRYGHYNPPQTAIEDEQDTWARHAAASNGFGDLI